MSAATQAPSATGQAHSPQRSEPGETHYLPAGALHLIQHSGLFDLDYYLACNPDMAPLRQEALAHYHQYGWSEGRKPNLYFDPAWYLEQNEDVAAQGIDPLLHYILRGEAEGCRPGMWFDPTWYRANHEVPDGMHALRHYLLNRAGGTVSAMAEFDTPFYLRTYPDVAEAGIDPLEHYMVQGFREARRPFAGFDPAFYRQRYLDGSTDANPLLHYLAHRERADVHPSLPAGETTLPREMRRNTRPGPFFETVRALPGTAIRRARVLAYYLPQFHAMKRNDDWWGEGFTEWTNVARGLPRFAGHYQPRIPRDLGHYRLEGTAVLRRQAEMARAAGIEGFVFYFYWVQNGNIREKRTFPNGLARNVGMLSQNPTQLGFIGASTTSSGPPFPFVLRAKVGISGKPHGQRRGRVPKMGLSTPATLRPRPKRPTPADLNDVPLGSNDNLETGLSWDSVPRPRC
jgi:hypothetical protein